MIPTNSIETHVVQLLELVITSPDLCCLFQGILGSIHSGKSALVHRYLTGSYMQEESPEGKNWGGKVYNRDGEGGYPKVMVNN